MELKPISQILVYTALNYAGEGIRKNLVLSMTNIYGVEDKENHILYLYDNNKEYIGVIDLKCPNTINNYTWK